MKNLEPLVIFACVAALKCFTQTEESLGSRKDELQ